MNKYERYKKVNLPWLKEIPNHWCIDKTKRFSENKKEINKGNRERNILSLTLKGVVKNNIENPNGLTPESYETYQIFEKNDLVFKLIDLENIKTSRVGIVEENGIMSSAYIRLVFGSSIYPKYVYYYFFKLYIEQVYNNLGSGVRSTMNSNDLKDILLPIPPIKEQVQIANYLDWKINEIDRLIQIEKEKIKELENLRFNVIYKFILKGIDTQNYKKSNINWVDTIPVHWNELSIRGCVNIIRGNSTFTKDDLSNQGKYVGLQYGKVYKTEIIDSDFEFYVSDKFYKPSQIVNRNDIIIVSTSETLEDLGHTSFYDREAIGLIGGEQILLKPLNNINPKYLFYLSKVFRFQLQLRAAGIKVYRFKISDLKKIYLPVPPIKEQEKIVLYIEFKIKQIDENMKNNYLLIEKLELLKQSLISEVVTGQIDVRDIAIPEYEKVAIADEEIEETDEMEGKEYGS